MTAITRAAQVAASAPAWAPRVPARRRVMPSDLEFARQKLAMHASVAAVAGMMGVSVPDLQAALADKLPAVAADGEAAEPLPALVARLRAALRIFPAEAKLLAALLQPAGVVVYPTAEQVETWRVQVGNIRAALDAEGLEGAVETGLAAWSPAGPAGPKGWFVSRESARRIRTRLAEIARDGGR
jgi:hypothetical protein